MLAFSSNALSTTTEIIDYSLSLIVLMKTVIFKTTYLILSWISDQSLGVSKCNIGGSCPITLVIGNDLHFAMLEHSDTGVGGAQVNTNCLLLGHFV